MSLIDKIKENPNLIKRVDINLHHLNNAAVTKDYLKKKIINQLASYLLKQGLIGYEEKDEGGITKIRATCYAVDIDKLKIMHDMDKEVLEKLKRIYDQEDTFGRKLMEKEFPELAESDDERIRKEMIEVLKKEAKEFPSSVIASKANSWIGWLEKQSEQKPAEWSEEDKTMLQRAIYYTNYYQTNYADTKEAEECMNWLKSLKDRVLSQSKQGEQNPTLSEEDESRFEGIIDDLEYDSQLCTSQIEWLKSLKERFKNV